MTAQRIRFIDIEWDWDIEISERTRQWVLDYNGFLAIGYVKDISENSYWLARQWSDLVLLAGSVKFRHIYRVCTSQEWSLA